MDMEQFVEKRKHGRLRTKDGTFAVIGPNVERLGQIIDISVDGLSLSYIDNGGKADGLSELDILFAIDGFYLEKVPFKTVSDFEIHVNKDILFTSIIMRRCGVQFGDLDDKQISQLEYFLRNHTII